MSSKYPRNTYVITYSYEDKLFTMKNNGEVVATGTHGRELGREAWDKDAEEVKYCYDLGIDEHIPLKPRHAQFFKA